MLYIKPLQSRWVFNIRVSIRVICITLHRNHIAFLLLSLLIMLMAGDGISRLPECDAAVKQNNILSSSKDANVAHLKWWSCHDPKWMMFYVLCIRHQRADIALKSIKQQCNEVSCINYNMVRISRFCMFGDYVVSTQRKFFLPCSVQLCVRCRIVTQLISPCKFTGSSSLVKCKARPTPCTLLVLACMLHCFSSGVVSEADKPGIWKRLAQNNKQVIKNAWGDLVFHKIVWMTKQTGWRETFTANNLSFSGCNPVVTRVLPLFHCHFCFFFITASFDIVRKCNFSIEAVHTRT